MKLMCSLTKCALHVANDLFHSDEGYMDVDMCSYMKCSINDHLIGKLVKAQHIRAVCCVQATNLC